MPFFIIFVIIPLVEISLFVMVGERIGVFPTLLLCALSAMTGAMLLRHQGIITLLSARRTMVQGGMPGQELFDGICVALAGVLLITPGFLTDAIGLLLLVPPLRRFLQKRLLRYFDMPESMDGSPSDIIDVEFRRLEERDES